MRLLVNALSVDNLSGRHVLLGHLRQVSARANVERLFVLHNRFNADLVAGLAPHAEGVACPDYTGHWIGRASWERTRLRAVAKNLGVECVFAPSGYTSRELGLPQIVLAQNPWCLLPELHEGRGERVKAALQRRAYRNAQQRATVMFFNSEFMRRAYRDNAGRDARQAIVLHQGVDDATFSAAASIMDFDERQDRILVVSVMARHKAVEDVVEALARLGKRGLRIGADVVGPWPDETYRRFVLGRVKAAGLTDSVRFHGAVDRDRLHEFYSHARAFCLLSRCESFGIPAVEAQAFGTPTVVADCCAPPEIAGPGGAVVAPGDIDAAADALESMVASRTDWERLSGNARRNADRFHWNACSRPLVDWINAQG